MTIKNQKNNFKTRKNAFSVQTKTITEYYRDLYKKHGYSLDTLVIPKGGQDARFKSKFDIGDLENTKILDVGCGFGHMLDYIKAWGINAYYTGIDICPEMIETAKKRHADADFRLLNILEDPIPEQWDWVFEAGVFNDTRNSKNWWDYVQNMLRQMFALCSKGVAADFLSIYVDYQKESAFHVSPEQVFSFAKTLTKRATLRHDYMAYEFTVYLYKDQAVTNNNTFVDFKKKVLPEPKI